MMTKTAQAQWEGGLKDGHGTICTQSGAVIDQPYGFDTRFDGKPGTNPEELIGAAHAACFSMALSNVLGEAEITPDRIETDATVYLSMTDGPKVERSHLAVKICAKGDHDAIMEAAEEAKKNCPISRLLDCEITMEAEILSA